MTRDTISTKALLYRTGGAYFDVEWATKMIQKSQPPISHQIQIYSPSEVKKWSISMSKVSLYVLATQII